MNSLKIEESALTGESVPVEKDLGKHNRAYMSTNVTYGRGEGVVTAIGMDTEIGRIARMIGETPAETTPLQKRLADLGKLLSAVSVALCALLFGVAVLQHRDVMEMLITAISPGCGRRAGGPARRRDHGAGFKRLPHGEGKYHRQAPAKRGDSGLRQRRLL